ncbi:MAG: hypothetical protein D6704_02415 [Nitrospirae bacterium]|nr:MAG: hypothetical protein D6704_02415 [Nitrospirota bacterium]
MFLLSFFCLVHIVAPWDQFSDLLNGKLIGTDSYMHLNRVRHLLETGSWYDPLYPRSNAPYGEMLHWTRAFDIILLLGPFLTSPFIPVYSALHWWGVVISPLLEGVALIGLIWGLRPFFAREQLSLLGGMFILQPAILGYCLAGRPDHHSLLIAESVWFHMLTLRALLNPDQHRWSWLTGLVGAVLLWTSVEGFISLGISLMMCALYWVSHGQPFSKVAGRIMSSLLIGATCLLLIERPWEGITVIEFDRYSIVHWSVIAWGWGLWMGLCGLERLHPQDISWSIRASVLFLGVAFAAGCQEMLFPKFFQGPFADLDPSTFSFLWNSIVETQPLLSFGPFQVGHFVFYAGATLPAIPYLAHLLRKTNAPVMKLLWTYIGIGLLLTFPFALLQIRSTPFAALFWIVPYTDLLWRLYTRIGYNVYLPWRRFYQAVIVLFGAAGFTVLGSFIIKLEHSAPHPIGESAPVRLLAQFLRAPTTFGDRPRTILAMVNFGPELLYRTPHRVIATPYHRNLQAILDTNAIMQAAQETEAYRLLKARAVDLIIIYPNSGERTLYADGSGKAPFYDRLVSGNLPVWLKEVELPDELAGFFRLFEIRRGVSPPLRHLSSQRSPAATIYHPMYYQRRTLTIVS